MRVSTLQYPCVLLLAGISTLSAFSLAHGLACYVCTSVNGSYPDCEDPVKGSIPFEVPCRQGRPGYEGLSYARHCVKIKGVRVSDGQSIYIRRCSMDKLADIPTHCGQFRLSDDLYQGCIATCSQNWCNAASRYSPVDLGLTATSLLLLLIQLT